MLWTNGVDFLLLLAPHILIVRVLDLFLQFIEVPFLLVYPTLTMLKDKSERVKGPCT